MFPFFVVCPSQQTCCWLQLNFLCVTTSAGELLLSFRATVPCWQRAALAASPTGLPGWHPATRLHHCQWGGVACCTIRDKPLAEEGPVLRRGAVCSVRLAAAPATEQQQPSSPGARAGREAPVAPPPGPVDACGSGGAASIAPLLGLEWLQEL